MKRITVILLLLVYGIATMGATIHLHYCMNSLVGWSLWHKKSNKCSKCGMQDKKGCCKDEHQYAKLKVAHPKATPQYDNQLMAVPALLTPIIIWHGSLPILSNDLSAPNAPPKIPISKLFIRHCVFRI